MRVDLLHASDNYYWPTNLHLREPLLVFCCSENIHYFICIQWPGAKKYWSVNGYHERVYESSLYFMTNIENVNCVHRELSILLLGLGCM